MKVFFMEFFKVFILIHLIVNTLAQWCNLNYRDDQWLREWRLIVVPSRNGGFELLRDGFVGVNRNIYLLGNSQPPFLRATCTRERRFNPLLPLQNPCPENLSIRPERRIEQTNHCRYTFFRIGFDVRINGQNHFLETYSVCFDMDHMRPVYTINTAYPVGGRRPDFMRFLPDDIFDNDLFHAYDIRNIIPRFNHLLGHGQRYMIPGNENHIIDRGHLTPSADFTLINLKRTTFSLINAIPQFKTIDNNNWRLIEEWVRNRERAPVHVCTGVIDCDLTKERAAELTCVLKLQDTRRRWVPIFLADQRRIPIPLWIYKIVRFPDNPIVFLTLNNIHQRNEIEVPQRMCHQIECPLQLTQTFQLGRTYCCRYREFIDNNVAHLRNVC